MNADYQSTSVHGALYSFMFVALRLDKCKLRTCRSESPKDENPFIVLESIHGALPSNEPPGLIQH